MSGVIGYFVDVIFPNTSNKYQGQSRKDHLHPKRDGNFVLLSSP